MTHKQKLERLGVQFPPPPPTKRHRLKPLTGEQKRDIIRLIKQGRTLLEICERVGCRKGQASRHLLKTGVYIWVTNSEFETYKKHAATRPCRAGQGIAAGGNKDENGN